MSTGQLCENEVALPCLAVRSRWAFSSSRPVIDRLTDAAQSCRPPIENVLQRSAMRTSAVMLSISRNTGYKVGRRTVDSLLP
jgi:hypothetical protein